MTISDTKIMMFEIISMASVYGLGYVIAVARNLYVSGITPHSPHIGGAITLATYGILWILFSKYQYDTAWATKRDFMETDKSDMDMLEGWEE